MTRVLSAAVIGGGIAGPVAALALQKAGIEATVYEGHASTADGLGGTIALAPNGLAALDIVGAAEPTVAVAQPIEHQVMTVGADKRLELPKLAGVGPLQTIRRGDLYQVLRDRATASGIKFEHGKRLVEVRDSSVIFADGGDARADVVIGADGVHSTVRRLIDPSAPGPKYTGMLAFEGLSTAEVPGDRRTMTFAFGKRGYYLYWPAASGGTIWGINLPHARPLSLTEARGGSWLPALAATYGADVPGADLVGQTSPERLQVNGALHIMPPVPHWYRGRMVLVGDAVHAPSNSSGQGASLAIESAIQLARCLRDMADLPSAFAAYERLRRERVERIAAAASRTNRTKAPGPVGRALMPILMPLFMRLVMKPEKLLGPVLRYRIDWSTRVSS
jgi:2-polyprenyl-6-methoxyphenol hydroxylase-like FAD-dependent oxidoreductase